MMKHTPRGPDLTAPSLYLNRELSLLEFHRRVLEQAKDAQTPLLERLRFLTISTTNIDEFFEIRVAGLKEQVAHGLAHAGPDGLSPEDVLDRVSQTTHQIVEEQYRVLHQVLYPALAAEGIHVRAPDRWTPRQAAWLRRHFAAEIQPILTPLGLDPAHPFPKVPNKSLCFLVSVEGQDAFGRNIGVAVLQLPRSIPRVIRLPKGVAEADYDFVLLSAVVTAHMADLFPGMRVHGAYQFRVTRNSDLWVDEEEVDDLLYALKGELPGRHYGDAVRLEVADDCPDDLVQFLLGHFSLTEKDLYRVPGPVNLHRLVAVHEMVDRPSLKYAPFVPGMPRRVRGAPDMFDLLRRGDVLLHHPYESFAPVIELVRQAAADPRVLAVKQTLYRTGVGSPVVESLIDASRAGKEVTVVIELRARFDEEQNINLATRLQEAGVNVVYGIVGYKAHAKLLLVVRREGKRLRRYVHLGTGNYHATTTRTYTDISLLTCHPEIGEDVHRLFLQLTGLGRVSRLRKLLQSPFTLQRNLLALIEREASAAREGKPARIIAKMNGLTEPRIIQALYRASQAGVPIDLIVRGICCLRPGVKGISETIRVRSIVGRFLEHSRAYYFLAGGREETLCSSADWMERNLFRRVETCFPVEDPRLKLRVLGEALEAYLDDNTQAWDLSVDGRYRRARPGRTPARAVQTYLLSRLLG